MFHSGIWRVLCFVIMWYNQHSVKTKMKIVNDLNLKKQAEDLGVKVWLTPGFLFLVMGLVAAVIMTATYYISRNSDDPKILVIAESLVAIVILVIGSAIIRMVEQIAKVNKMKSEFISIASHQLRTPLSAIQWETELLITKYKKGLNEKQLEAVSTIGSSVFRMIKLVNDLLDVTRIEQKRLILRKIYLDIAKITEEVIGGVLPLARARNIELVMGTKKKMPQVMGDPEKIKMVIENLVNNAIKYTANKGKIDIKITTREKFLVFSVKDNGVGIPEEQHSRVFDKFFRSDNAVRYQTEGTGLGLYIAKNIIEQSGGRIWFNSVENLGSIFYFSLPIK